MIVLYIERWCAFQMSRPRARRIDELRIIWREKPSSYFFSRGNETYSRNVWSALWRIVAYKASLSFIIRHLVPSKKKKRLSILDRIRGGHNESGIHCVLVVVFCCSCCWPPPPPGSWAIDAHLFFSQNQWTAEAKLFQHPFKRPPAARNFPLGGWKIIDLSSLQQPLYSPPFALGDRGGRGRIDWWSLYILFHPNGW